MRPFHDSARFWRSPLLPDMELLSAQYFRHEFAPHWHEEFSIPIVEVGAQGYRYRGKYLIGRPGGIMAINPGEVHTGERAADIGWAYRAFYPSAALMRRIAADLSGKPADVPWLPDCVIEDAEVAAKLLRAHRAMEAGADPLATETLLIDGLSLLVMRHALSAPQPASLHADQARVARMQARLAEQLDEPLGLSELAAQVGLSPYHATRLFARTVGIPPHAWRNQLRLQRARALLRQGLSVAEAAAATGFADQSHFTHSFKRSYGVPPGHWQKAR